MTDRPTARQTDRHYQESKYTRLATQRETITGNLEKSKNKQAQKNRNAT